MQLVSYKYTNMKVKRERHGIIKHLLRTQSISNQIDLQDLLKQRGFEVTQATLSRDIRELRITKSHDEEGNYIYVLLPEKPKTNPLDLSSLRFSGNLAVLKTRPGYAMGIASDIDNNLSKGIIGTIAGDDTILLILKENADRDTIIADLSGILQNR